MGDERIDKGELRNDRLGIAISGVSSLAEAYRAYTTVMVDI